MKQSVKLMISVNYLGIKRFKMFRCFFTHTLTPDLLKVNLACEFYHFNAQRKDQIHDERKSF